MSDRTKNIVTTILFLMVIIIPFFINIVKKDNDISISERRKLEKFPEITISKIFNGTVFERFEKYTMDQFIGREQFRKLKINTEFYLFGKKDYNNLYNYNGYIVSQNYPLNEKSVKNIINKITNINEKYLTQDNNIYYTIIPDKNYFVNDSNLRIDYDKIEEMMIEELEFAKYIKINDKLELNDYYKTDTHWKQENLEKIAQYIAKEMGKSLDTEYEEQTVSEFNGVYSGQLPVVKQKDNIKILTNTELENCTVYNYENKEITPIYNMSKLNSSDKYDIYLSGAVPLMTITNPENSEGKELIVFRDSYASSLIPLLVNSYSKITLADTRYISPKLLEQYIEFNNKDILFMYSTLVINNSTALK